MEHEDFVTFEQAYQLKQLGFDWKCNHIYKNKEHTLFHCLQDAYDNHNAFTKRLTDDLVVSAPTLSQVQKWLMDEKKILISVRPNDFVNDSGNTEIHYTTDIFGTSKGYLELLHSESGYENYEFALEDGINEALEILKN